MYAEDELLPISALVDIVFCRRRAALHRLEGIWEESVSTIEGHNLHDKVHDDKGESRGDVRISRGVRLRSLRLGLTGAADVVEFHRSDDQGFKVPGLPHRWLPFPVEYKRGILRHEESFEIQLCAQAICLEEMLQCHVAEGALFYGMSRRRHDVLFSEELRAKTGAAASDLHMLLDAGLTPAAVYEKKCEKCSLFSTCMPETTGAGKSAVRYVARMLKDEEAS